MDFIKVHIKVKALTPIFSSGENLSPDEKSILGVKKYIPLRVGLDGKVIIPLKGKIRIATEQILKSAGVNVCNLDKNIRGCGQCKACDIFGSMNKRGRWLVGNLISEDFAEDITNVYTHTTTRRGTFTLDLKKVYNLQEVEPGAVFNSEIIILQPQKDDVRILRSALELASIVGVGGLVSKGFGKIEIMDFKAEEHNFSEFYDT